jgi:hypothetical protein
MTGPETPARIVWLASYPKSGNTWLRAFLANYIENRESPIPINELGRFAPHEATRASYDALAKQSGKELDDGEVYRLRPQVQRMTNRRAQTFVFMKTHAALVQVNGVRTIAPEVTAGAIYVVRNPLDVAVSFANHMGCGLDEAIAALTNEATELPIVQNLVHEHLGSWSGHVRSWLETPGLSPHLIRYEDLSRDPGGVFGKLVEFLRLPPEPARLKRAIAFASFKELAGQESSGGFKEKPSSPDRFFRSGKAGSWRDALSESQAERIVADHGQVMRRLGYLDSGGALVF